jgi:hypothetical protein
MSTAVLTDLHRIVISRSLATEFSLAYSEVRRHASQTRRVVELSLSAYATAS